MNYIFRTWQQPSRTMIIPVVGLALPCPISPSVGSAFMVAQHSANCKDGSSCFVPYPFFYGTEPFFYGAEPFFYGTEPFFCGAVPFGYGTALFGYGAESFGYGAEPFSYGTEPFYGNYSAILVPRSALCERNVWACGNHHHFIRVCFTHRSLKFFLKSKIHSSVNL